MSAYGGSSARLLSLACREPSRPYCAAPRSRVPYAGTSRLVAGRTIASSIGHGFDECRERLVIWVSHRLSDWYTGDRVIRDEVIGCDHEVAARTLVHARSLAGERIQEVGRALRQTN